jgi:hypothetical protein
MADITGSYNPTLIYGDNQAALALMKNVCAGAQNRTKHFDVALNFARYRVMLRDTVMRYIATGKMVADVMTKQVPGPAFRKHRDALGVRRVEDAERGGMLECGCAFCIYMRKCWQMIREAKFA